MAWVVLLVAGFLEVVWATSLKLSRGFTRPVPSLLTVVAVVGSVYLLSLAMRTIPAGTAYAVWVGIGAAALAAIGVVAFGEPLTPLRLLSLALILLGVIGLRLAEGG